MKTWPRVDLPVLAQTFPKLKLKCTLGSLPAPSSDWRMYVCGITPYDATHLGHAATYLTFDLINRYQKYAGGEVNFVENITDIDDPLLERANRDNQNWEELAHDQISLFAEDMQSLRVLPPKYFTPVTSAMNQIQDAILALHRSGKTYELEGDLYFQIEPFLDALPIPLEEALRIFGERGGDPLRVGKMNPLDPLLWLRHRNDEPKWEFELGAGRPGWHLECSVIALEHLYNGRENKNRASTIDLQGGGCDLIFPHHFMSAALAKALTGLEFASSYVHTGMVGLDGEKMSKSKGNLVFVSKLLASGVDPMVIRYALLNSHYAQDRMWTDDLLVLANEKVARIRQVLSRNEVLMEGDLFDRLIGALSNDLDTVEALQILDEWTKLNLESNLDASPESLVKPGEISRFIDGLLGLTF